jgi:adenylosuccinate synthase
MSLSSMVTFEASSSPYLFSSHKHPGGRFFPSAAPRWAQTRPLRWAQTRPLRWVSPQATLATEKVGASGGGADRVASLSQVTGVLGSQWGDEGKGKLVDILAKNFDIVARCQVM